MPVALIDSAEGGLQEIFEKNCEPSQINKVEGDYIQEGHDPAPGSRVEAEDTCPPHSKVVRSAGNAAFYAPVRADETGHGLDCSVAPQTQWGSSLAQ